jgi:hypothetical protein
MGPVSIVLIGLNGGLALILERKPHLFAVRRGGDVWAERAFLLHARHDGVVGD